jgi:hypothetical protein
MANDEMVNVRYMVDDVDASVFADVKRGNLRNDIVTGPGGEQILLEDPSDNVVEFFQPAAG